MASQVSTASLVLCMKGDLDFDTATLKVMLLKNSYTTNPDHNFVDDLAASECDATNYTGGFAGAGRKTLSSVTITEDTANNRAVLDAADPATWTTLGGATNNTLRYMAVIREVTNDAASPVIAVLDFGSDKTTVAVDFTVAIAALGIYYIQT